MSSEWYLNLRPLIEATSLRGHNDRCDAVAWVVLELERLSVALDTADKIGVGLAKDVERLSRRIELAAWWLREDAADDDTARVRALAALNGEQDEAELGADRVKP